MKNESKTLRNVCVPRLLRSAGGRTVKVIIPQESWDPVLAHQLPGGENGLWKWLRALERVISVATHPVGSLGTVSTLPGCACMQGCVGVGVAFTVNTE